MVTPRRFRHKRAPAVERGDVARAVDRGGLDDEALDAAAVGRRTVPIDIGGGIAATNLPNAAAGSAQTSSSIDDPVPASTRSMPGFGGVVSSA